MAENKVKIGIIGFGRIGSALVKLLLESRHLFKEKTGIDLELSAVCDKDIRTKRDIHIPKGLLTTDIYRVIDNTDIDVVVELIGGVHPAKEIIIKALCAGKNIVTANKLLLAEEGVDIFEKAREMDRQILFEASVAGGLPIIKVIREGLIANKFSSIFGILNGTSNYILSQMSGDGCPFKDALKTAQDRGYAERDPRLDIDGLDSAHKLAILSLLAFGKKVTLRDIYVEGIREISPIDIQYAKELGYVIKLLAIAKQDRGELELRVHPTLISSHHLLASVNGVYNAIFIDGDLVGKQVYYGEGAGRLPTASALLSDIIDIGYSIIYNRGKFVDDESRVNKIDNVQAIKKIGDVFTRYYINFSAIDKPGVLANIAELLGKHNISIASVVQKERRRSDIVPIVMLTHEAKEKDMRDALEEIDKLSVIKRKSVRIRVEDV